MDICGEARSPARSDLLRLAKEADLPQRDALAVMEKYADTAGRLTEIAKAFPITHSTLKQITARVEANRQRL